jgi:hypothetical protein
VHRLLALLADSPREVAEALLDDCLAFRDLLEAREPDGTSRAAAAPPALLLAVHWLCHPAIRALLLDARIFDRFFSAAFVDALRGRLSAATASPPPKGPAWRRIAQVVADASGDVDVVTLFSALRDHAGAVAATVETLYARGLAVLMERQSPLLARVPKLLVLALSFAYQCLVAAPRAASGPRVDAERLLALLLNEELARAVALLLLRDAAPGFGAALLAQPRAGELLRLLRDSIPQLGALPRARTPALSPASLTLSLSLPLRFPLSRAAALFVEAAGAIVLVWHVSASVDDGADAQLVAADATVAAAEAARLSQLLDVAVEWCARVARGSVPLRDVCSDAVLAAALDVVRASLASADGEIADAHRDKAPRRDVLAMHRQLAAARAAVALLHSNVMQAFLTQSEALWRLLDDPRVWAALFDSAGGRGAHWRAVLLARDSGALKVLRELARALEALADSSRLPLLMAVADFAAGELPRGARRCCCRCRCRRRLLLSR